MLLKTKQEKRLYSITEKIDYAERAHFTLYL